MRYWLAGLCGLLGMAAATAADELAGWEFGVNLGQASFDHRRASTLAQFPSVPATAMLSDSDTGYKFYSAYRLDPVLSLELTLVDLGDVLAEDGASLTNLYGVMGFSAEAIGRLPVGPDTHVFGGFGFFVWDTSSPNLTTVDSGTELTYGLGLDVNLYGGSERRLRIEWERYEFDSVMLRSADFISAGLLFAF